MNLHIAIIGLGYVGTTTAGCMLRDGHSVLGVDTNPEKRRSLARGRAPMTEPKIDTLLQEGVEDSRLQIRSSLRADIDRLDLVLVCVGTPLDADGKLDLRHVKSALHELGLAIPKRSRRKPPLPIVFRSTMLPGTMDNLVLPTLERMIGEPPGTIWEPALNPEFLRESTAVDDHFDPPKIVIGERLPGVTQQVLGIYREIKAPLFEVDFRTAEMIKFVDNSFHALKVAFANEMGRLCQTMEIQSEKITEIFLADRKLNVSPAYLRPGAPFGGSCLPKDLKAMTTLAREIGTALPLLNGISISNRAHLHFVLEVVKAAMHPPGPILQLGLSFKPGTDDLRNSPLVNLAEALLSAGYRLKIYDPDLDPERIASDDKAFALPQNSLLSRCITTELNKGLSEAELVILGKELPHLRSILPANMKTIDLPRFTM